MFGVNGSEFLILIVVAVVVVGPERLPRYAEKLGVWVRTARGFLRAAKQRVDEEIGDQAGDVDWAALDPRRYDPRRIVREALLDDLPGAPPSVPPSSFPAAAAAQEAEVAPGEVAEAAPGEVGVAPYDDEAT